MGVFTATDPASGRVRQFEIAGDTPTPQEQQQIAGYFGYEAPQSGFMGAPATTGFDFEAEVARELARRTAAQPASTATGPEAPPSSAFMIGVERNPLQRALANATSGRVLAEGAGNEELAAYFRQQEEEALAALQQFESEVDSVGLFDIEGVGTAGRFAGEALGEEARDFAIQASAMGIGAGIGSFFGGIGAVPGAAIGRAVGVGYTTVEMLPQLFSEAINAQEQAGDDPNIAKAALTTAINAAIEFGGDYLTLGAAGSGRKILQRALAQGGEGAAIQGGTEVLQEFNTRAMAGLPLADEEALRSYAEAAAAAIVVGGTAGGIAGAVQPSNEESQLEQDQKEEALAAAKDAQRVLEAQRKEAAEAAAAGAAPETTPQQPEVDAQNRMDEGSQEQLKREVTREAQKTYQPVALSQLPDPERKAIIAARNTAGLDPAENATIEEIQSVVGIDAATREAAKQKPVTAAADAGVYNPIENRSFNQAQIDAAIERVRKTGKPATFQDVRKAVSNVSKETVPSKVVNDIFDEMVSRGIVRRVQEGNRKSYQLETEDVNLPAAQLQRQIDDLGRQVEEAEKRRDRLAIEFKRISETGKDINGREARPSEASASVEAAQKQVADLKNQQELVRQRLRESDPLSGIPYSDDPRATLQTTSRALNTAQATLKQAQKAVSDAGAQATPAMRAAVDTAQSTVSGLQAARDRLRNRIQTPSTQTQVKVAETAGKNARYIAGLDGGKYVPFTPGYNDRFRDVMDNLRKRLDKINLKDVRLRIEDTIDGEVDVEGTYANQIIRLASALHDPALSDQEMNDRIAAVMNHEVIHALKGMGLFTDAEWQSLTNAASNTNYVMLKRGKPVKRTYTYLRRAQRMYEDETPEVQVEEAIAEMFRDYTTGKLKLSGRPQGLFKRIANFFKSIIGANTDSGFETPLDIFSAIERGELGARERVQQAAESFEAAGTNVRSSRRVRVPQRTIKAYKLFRIEDGQPNRIFPLFVNANEPVPIGEWIPARIGDDYSFQGANGNYYVPSPAFRRWDAKKGKYVTSKTGDSIPIPNDEVRRELFERGFINSMNTKSVTALARRPGWHAGDTPSATHIGAITDGGKVDTRRPTEVWAEVEIPADIDWQAIADSRAPIVKSGKRAGQIDVGEAHITDELPVGGYYRYKTNPNMQGNWIISGEMKVNRILTDDEVRQINAEAGVEDLPRRESSFADRIIPDLITKPRQSRRPVGGLTRLNSDTGDTPDRISTRQPWTQRATEDPLTQDLIIGLEAMKQNPEAFAFNMNVLKTYPGFNTSATDPDQIAEDFISFVSNNLRWLYNQVPQEIRERSKQWYDGARAITERWTDNYGLEDYKIAGVLAALSPQKDWYQNVSLGERVLDIYTAFKDNKTFTADERMRETADRIYGKPQYQEALGVVLNTPFADITNSEYKGMWARIYDETYNPRGYRVVSSEGNFIGEPQGNVAWGSNVEIAKAIRSIEAASRDDVSREMGTKHKVRNFYNNILAPNAPQGDVTIDTHAVAAGLLRPLSGNSYEVHHNFGSSPAVNKRNQGQWIPMKNIGDSGSHGSYGIFAEAYRRLANELGILPRQLQSITWEAVRGMFTARQKQSPAFVSNVNSVWSNSRLGDDLDAVRDRVLEVAGGIDDPTWYGRSDSGVSETREDSSYIKQLDPAQFSRRATGELAVRDGGSDGVARRTGAVSEQPVIDPEVERSMKEGERLSRRARRSVSAALQAQMNAASGTSNATLLHKKAREYTGISNWIGKSLGVVTRDYETAQKKTDKFYQTLFDSKIPIARVMERLEKEGLTLLDAMDPVMELQLQQSRAGTQVRFRKDKGGLYDNAITAVSQIQVTDAMKEGLKKVTRENNPRGTGIASYYFDLYTSDKQAVADMVLYAYHAQERNLRLRQVDPANTTPGSGMSDAEAQAIINFVERNFSPENKAAIDRVRRDIAAITADTNEVRVDAGLIPADFLEQPVETKDGRKLRAFNFENYVPIRGDTDDDATDGPTSVRRNSPTIRKFEDPRMKGRYSAEKDSYGVDIIGNLLYQNQRALVRAEENKSALSYVEMIEEANRQGITSEGEVILNEDTKNIPVARIIDKNGQVQWTSRHNFRQDDDVVIAKRNGREIVVRARDANIAGVFNGKNVWNPDHANVYLRYIYDFNRGLTRYLSAASTTFNPDFTLPNFFRDLEQAGVNIQDLDQKGLALRVMKGAPASVYGIAKAEFNNDVQSESARMYREFLADGGSSAANPMQSLRDEIRNIDSLLKELNEPSTAGQKAGAAGMKGLKKLGNFIETVNNSVENGVRLSTYIELRKILGDSPEARARAAQAARSVTVDFTQSGDLGGLINGLYMFYRASANGTIFMFRALARNPKKVGATLAGLAVAGFAIDMMNAFLSPEDDEGLNEYDDIPEYILEHNIIIMIPEPFRSEGGRPYVSIPLSYGLNFFYNTGRALSSYGRAKYTGSNHVNELETASSIGRTLLEIINPLGGSEHFMNFAAPTIADPFISIYGHGKDYMGRDIRPDAFPGQYSANSSLYWNTVSPTALGITGFLNEFTGGNEIRGGWVDISPETLEFWFDFSTGGAGAFLQRTAELPSVLTDEQRTFESKFRAIPLVRKFIGSVSEREDAESYFRFRDQVETVEAELKAYRNNGDVEGIRQLRTRYPNEIRAINVINNIERRRRDISRRINQIRDNDRISEDRKNELIRTLMQQRDLLIRRALRFQREQG